MMRTAEETRRGDERHRAQETRSWSRTLGIWLWSAPGRYVWNSANMAMIAIFCSYAAWNASAEYAVTKFRAVLTDEIVKSRNATIQNRCVGFAILERVGGDKAPPWCAQPMKDMRNEPEAVAPDISQIRP